MGALLELDIQVAKVKIQKCHHMATQPLPYSENGLVLTRGGVLRIYEYVAHPFIYYILFSLSHLLTDTQTTF